MVRWLYLSGLVFAVLIPAGWQVAPRDLEDLSRYGAGWSQGWGSSRSLSIPIAVPALPIPVLLFILD